MGLHSDAREVLLTTCCVCVVWKSCSSVTSTMYQCSMLCQCMESKMCFVSLGNRFSGPVETGEMCAITSVHQLHPILLKGPLHAFCSPFTCYYIQLCHLTESCYQSSCPDVTLTPFQLLVFNLILLELIYRCKSNLCIMAAISKMPTE